MTWAGCHQGMQGKIHTRHADRREPSDQVARERGACATTSRDDGPVGLFEVSRIGRERARHRGIQVAHFESRKVRHCAIQRNRRRFMSGIAHDRSRHPLATGLFAGAVVGVGLALLFAPRRGSEIRKQMGDGYRRVKGATGNLASRCNSMYVSTRDRVVKGAQGTSRYVRDVSDALTMKSQRQSDGSLRRVPANSPTSPTSGQPRKAV